MTFDRLFNSIFVLELYQLHHCENESGLILYIINAWFVVHQFHMKIASSSAELYEVGNIRRFIVLAEFHVGIGILSWYNQDVKSVVNNALEIHQIDEIVVDHLFDKL